MKSAAPPINHRDQSLLAILQRAHANILAQAGIYTIGLLEDIGYDGLQKINQLSAMEMSQIVQECRQRNIRLWPRVGESQEPDESQEAARPALIPRAATAGKPLNNDRTAERQPSVPAFERSTDDAKGGTTVLSRKPIAQRNISKVLKIDLADYEALNRAGFIIIQDLTKRTRAEVQQQAGLSNRAMAKLDFGFTKNQLRFRSENRHGCQENHPSPPTPMVDAVTDRRNRDESSGGIAAANQQGKDVSAESIASALNLDYEKVVRPLLAVGFINIKDLTEFTRSEIKECVPGLDDDDLDRIGFQLAQYQLSFKPEELETPDATSDPLPEQPQTPTAEEVTTMASDQPTPTLDIPRANLDLSGEITKAPDSGTPLAQFVEEPIVELLETKFNILTMEDLATRFPGVEIQGGLIREYLQRVLDEFKVRREIPATTPLPEQPQMPIVKEVTTIPKTNRKLTPILDRAVSALGGSLRSAPPKVRAAGFNYVKDLTVCARADFQEKTGWSSQKTAGVARQLALHELSFQGERWQDCLSGNNHPKPAAIKTRTDTDGTGTPISKYVSSWSLGKNLKDSGIDTMEALERSFPAMEERLHHVTRKAIKDALWRWRQEPSADPTDCPCTLPAACPAEPLPVPTVTPPAVPMPVNGQGLIAQTLDKTLETIANLRSGTTVNRFEVTIAFQQDGTQYLFTARMESAAP